MVISAAPGFFLFSDGLGFELLVEVFLLDVGRPLPIVLAVLVDESHLRLAQEL